MNSRERILTAFDHKISDRVPLDLGGVVSGIHIRTYKQLLKLLGLHDDNILFYDITQQLVLPCEEVLKRLHIDTRYLHLPKSFISENIIPEKFEKWIGIHDALGVFWGIDKNTEPNNILYFSPVINPLANLKTPEEIHDYNWPNGKDKKQFEGLRKYALDLQKKGSYALVSRVLGCIYEYTTFLFGLKTAMKHFRKNPELIQATMEELLKYWTDFAFTYLDEVGDLIDVIAINGDLADQSGPLINPKVYEKLVVPIEKEFVNRIRSRTNAPINYHSCGSVIQFYPYFKDLGYNAINPVQISAKGMNPCDIKKGFGDSIVFWGGLCNSQNTLPFGTPDQIRKEVAENLKCFKPNGGYIGSNVHNITAEVPAENVLAMFDAAYEFGSYS